MVSNSYTDVAVIFAYDHQSRRISKVVLDDGTETLRNEFTYDGWNLIHETILNSQFSITNSYVWGLDLSGTLQGAGGVGGLLSQTVISDSPTKSYFSLADANGNIIFQFHAPVVSPASCMAVRSKCPQPTSHKLGCSPSHPLSPVRNPFERGYR